MNKKLLNKANEVRERESVKDFLAEHKTEIAVGVGLIAVGVGLYLSYKYGLKKNNDEIELLKLDLASKDETILNHEIALDSITDELYVIKKTLADGEVIKKAMETTLRQINYKTTQLANLMNVTQVTEAIINKRTKLQEEIKRLEYVYETQGMAQTLAEIYEE